MLLALLFVVLSVLLIYVIWKFRNLDSDWQSFHTNIDPTYFDKKIIWITGASSGIGKALAKKIASFSDCTFILTARQEESLETTSKEIKSINKNSITFIFPMDLSNTDVSYYESMIEKLKTKFPNGVDIMIHSAGYSMRSCAIDFPLENDLDMFQVNLLSPIIITKLLLPEMTKKNLSKKAKDIVVISSAAGKALLPIRTTYGSCKAGIAAFHESLRYEVLPYNVHILNVFPGFVATNIDIHSLGKNGKNVGTQEDFIQNGLPAHRCAEIICASISNHLSECWPARPPILYLLYLASYLPFLKSIVMPKIAQRVLKEQGY